MKQKKLIRRVYQACLEHDDQTMEQLRQEEYRKILKHKSKGKTFDQKWTVIRL